MSRRFFSATRHVLALAIALGVVSPACADFYVICNTGNPQTRLTQQEAVDLFMGRNRAYGDGSYAQVFDLPRGQPARDGFYRALTGMRPAQITSYWSRLMFTGQTMPPQPLADEPAMLETVKRNASALGYLSAAPNDKHVRVLLVLREPG